MPLSALLAALLLLSPQDDLDNPKRWPVVLKGPRYQLWSDGPEKEAREILDYMELVFVNYTQLLDLSRPPNQKMVIVVYKDREGYVGGGAPPSSVAYYNGKRLVGYLEPPDQKEWMLSNFAHEGFHQFTDWGLKVMDKAPIWFTEGMADCISNARLEGSKLRVGVADGATARRYIQTVQPAVRDNSHVPLAKLLAMERSTFMAQADLLYPQAWSWCHFLLAYPEYEDKKAQIPHGRYWKVLQRYIQFMTRNTPHEKAWAQAFVDERGKPLDVATIEAEWKEYLLKWPETGAAAAAGPGAPAAIPGVAGRAVPPDAEIKAAEKLIRDLFKDDYAKRGASDRAALARNLLAQAGEGKAEGGHLYVLLREARTLAVESADIPLAVRAASLLTTAFKVDGFKLRLETLASLGKSAKIPAELTALAAEYLAVSADAASEDEMDTAEKACELAASHARRAKDVALAARADARRRAVRDERTALDKIRKARELLAKSPDDPAANELVGRHEAFKKGRLADAVPFLAKAAHAGLKNAAQRDLADPAGAVEQAAAGDAWWAVGDALDETSRPAARARAVHWYAKAVEGLEGEARRQAAARLRQGREEQLGPKAAWVDVPDPKSFGLSGAPGQPMTLKPPPEKALSAILTSRPPGTFDGVAVTIRRDPAGKAHSGLLFDEGNRIAFIDMAAPALLVARIKDGEWAHEFTREIEARDTFSLTLLLIRGEYAVHLDAEELIRLPSAAASLGEIGLFSGWAASTFQDVRLRRVTEPK